MPSVLRPSRLGDSPVPAHAVPSTAGPSPAYAPDPFAPADASDAPRSSAHRLLGHLDAVVAVLSAFRADVASLEALGRAAFASADVVDRPAHPVRPLTSAEAADRLQVAVDTISAWCVAGRFPNARSLGRSGWRIPLADLDALDIATPGRGRAGGRRKPRTPRTPASRASVAAGAGANG